MFAVKNLVLATTPIGTGLNLPLNPSPHAAWATINSMRVRMTMTATPGERLYVFVFSDAAGNKLFTAFGPQCAPGQEAVFSMGGGCPAVVSTGSGDELWSTVSIPIDFTVPPGATLNIHDGNSVDPNDSVLFCTAVIG